MRYPWPQCNQHLKKTYCSSAQLVWIAHWIRLPPCLQTQTSHSLGVPVSEIGWCFLNMVCFIGRSQQMRKSSEEKACTCFWSASTACSTARICPLSSEVPRPYRLPWKEMWNHNTKPIRITGPPLASVKAISPCCILGAEAGVQQKSLNSWRTWIGSILSQDTDSFWPQTDSTLMEYAVETGWAAPNAIASTVTSFPNIYLLLPSASLAISLPISFRLSLTCQFHKQQRKHKSNVV